MSLRLYIEVQRLIQSVSLRKATRNVFPTAHSVDMARQIWPLERHPHRVIHSGPAAAAASQAS